jgi:hypothetical protein
MVRFKPMAELIDEMVEVEWWRWKRVNRNAEVYQVDKRDFIYWVLSSVKDTKMQAMSSYNG